MVKAAIVAVCALLGNPTASDQPLLSISNFDAIACEHGNVTISLYRTEKLMDIKCEVDEHGM